MGKWVSYRNGNYVVMFNAENGTKIRHTKYDEFVPEFAECIDVYKTEGKVIGLFRHRGF